MLPSASVDSVGTPNSLITRLNSPACTCPSRRFAGALTNTDARFRVVAGRYSFDVELFHLLLHDGLSRRSYGTKFPKAVEKITSEVDVLLEFYNYPAEHWIHLRTTNPIESTFATVRLRTKVTKGPGSRRAGLAMAFKLIEAAQGRWRAVNAPHLVALVRAGATFCKGKLVERPTDEDAEIMVA